MVQLQTSWTTASENERYGQPSPHRRAHRNDGGSRRVYSTAEIDTYAQSVLESRVAPNLPPPDDSLGSYVTSSLRSAVAEQYDSIKEIPDFESLVELLQEHCACSESEAMESLEAIAVAVRTNEIPVVAHSATGSALRDRVTASLVPSASTSMIAPQSSLSVTNPQQSLTDEVRQEHPLRMAERKKNQVASPLHADDLIPVDLMGVLDDPITPKESNPSSTGKTTTTGAPYFHFAPGSNQQQGKSKTADDENAFPPLGALASASSTTNKKKAPKRGSGTKPQKAKDLAAALFGPSSRSRQSSIDETSPTLRSQPPPPETKPPPQCRPVHNQVSNGTALDSAFAENNYPLEQQQFESAVEILLSMNIDISEEAARAATQMAHADVNVAQYLIDSVISAPPICRHMLQNGCYRSDCQFSHDVNGSTCMFWLRGRCGKGPSCRFLHGFNPQLLEGISLPPMQQQQQQQQQIYPRHSISSDNTGSISSSSNQQMTQHAVFPDIRGGASSSLPTQVSPSIVSLGGATVWGNNSGDVKRKGAVSSFANVASRGYSSSSAQFTDDSTARRSQPSTYHKPKKVDIPQELWSAHENRDASAFYIADPLERYRVVSEQSAASRRDNVLDLHFQSSKTFSVVLTEVLPVKLERNDKVWIVTGTGHHVGRKTHQKGGGALESAVVKWLTEQGYEFALGRDRNGLSGTLLVFRPEYQQ